MNIGDRIKHYRKQSGFTQQQLAEALDVSFQAVSSWECGDYQPSINKLELLSKVLGISTSKLLDNEEEIQGRWELHDRMFSEEHMYTFIRSAASAKGLTQTAKVLPLAKKLHSGQTRKGKEAVPYIYHPLMLACHALALGLDEDDIIATALLHDTVEDCGIEAAELPVSQQVRTAVELLSFHIDDGENKIQAKERYYQNISENRLATIVKVLDRCNNISSMAMAFTVEKLIEYINETENYVIPVLESMKHNYPECYNAAFILKYQMLSVLESLKRTIL